MYVQPAIRNPVVAALIDPRPSHRKDPKDIRPTEQSHKAYSAY